MSITICPVTPSFVAEVGGVDLSALAEAVMPGRGDAVTR